MSAVQIALVQHRATPDKAFALERALGAIARAAELGCHLAVFPEVDMANPEEVVPASAAEELDGPFVGAIRAAAARHGVAVVTGVLERIDGEATRARNAVIYVDGRGELRQVYRKTHLYDAFGAGESGLFHPGSEAPQVFDAGWARVGLMVCYELRFPEVARTLALGGAQVLIVPAAWVRGPLKEEHWLLLTRARALENTVFVVGLNNVFGENTGRSLVVDPMGVVIGEAGEQEGVIPVRLDLARVAATRAKLPALRHRRPELYAGLTERERA